MIGEAVDRKEDTGGVELVYNELTRAVKTCTHYLSSTLAGEKNYA